MSHGGSMSRDGGASVALLMGGDGGAGLSGGDPRGLAAVNAHGSHGSLNAQSASESDWSATDGEHSRRGAYVGVGDGATATRGGARGSKAAPGCRSCCLTRRAPWWQRGIEATFVVGCSWAWNWAMSTATCGVIFRCGCTFPWAGGWDNCNVHRPTGPRCPRCIMPTSSAWTQDNRLVAVIMLLGYVAATWILVKRSSQRIRNKWGWIRFAMPLIMFVLYSLISGIIMVMATGYPYLLWFTFKDTQPYSPPLPPYLPNSTSAIAE